MQTKEATGVPGIKVIRVYYPALMHPRPPQLRERRNVLGIGLSSIMTSSGAGPYQHLHQRLALLAQSIRGSLALLGEEGLVLRVEVTIDE